MLRRTTSFALILATFVGTGLFIVKNKVQDLEDKLKKINSDIGVEKMEQHVLQAEWSHLNETNRIRELISRHLELKPLAANQFFAEDKITELLDEWKASRVALKAQRKAFDFKSQMNSALNGGKSE